MTGAVQRIGPADLPAQPPEAEPDGGIWVLDDPRAGTAAQALGIAERLGMPFRRLPMAWTWLAHLAALRRAGSLAGLAIRPAGLLAAPGPSLVISAGARSAAVALWLKGRHGAALVHCMRPGLGGILRGDTWDLLVIPEHDRPPAADNIIPVLGAPHRLSPLLLEQARLAWKDRLAHLPHPRIALLVGGPVGGTDMPPALANRLGERVAALARRHGGAVLATTSRRTGGEASDALAAGLSRCLHELYRWGEPGENPYLGFLASADAVIATADSVSMLSEACATAVPVYAALPELAGMRHRRLVESLVAAGQVRWLGRDLISWQRPPLDEAGRVAAEILRRFPLES